MMIPSAIHFDKLSDLKYPGVSSKAPYDSFWDLVARYGISKLANILFTTSLQQRQPNILCASCDPGHSKTNGAISAWPSFLQTIPSWLFATPALGARPVLFLAAGKDVAAERDRYKGAYVGRGCKIQMPSLLARDTEVAENLWKLSEEALAAWLEE